MRIYSIGFTKFILSICSILFVLTSFSLVLSAKPSKDRVHKQLLKKSRTRMKPSYWTAFLRVYLKPTQVQLCGKGGANSRLKKIRKASNKLRRLLQMEDSLASKLFQSGLYKESYYIRIQLMMILFKYQEASAGQLRAGEKCCHDCFYQMANGLDIYTDKIGDYIKLHLQKAKQKTNRKYLKKLCSILNKKLIKSHKIKICH